MHTVQNIKESILESIAKTIVVKTVFDSPGVIHVRDYRVTFKIPKYIKVGLSGIDNNTVVFEFREREKTIALQE